MIIPWMSMLLGFSSGISAQAPSSSLRHLRGALAKTISGTMCGKVRATALLCLHSPSESKQSGTAAGAPVYSRAEAHAYLGHHGIQKRHLSQTFTSRQHCVELSQNAFFSFKISSLIFYVKWVPVFLHCSY